MALASDVNNTQFAGAVDPDSVMIARFYKRAVQNNFETNRQGRPIYEDRIYCEYYPAGSTLLRMDIPVREEHKQRFSKLWAFFQSTQAGDQREVGTPLSQWQILSPADAENLRGMKFQTVENIAGASDLMLQVLGMGIGGMAPHVLRARAQAYLGAAKDTALPQKQAEDIEVLKKQMAEQDAKHAMEMAQMREMFENLGGKKKAKKGWTAEQRAATGERLKAAREAKKVKPDGVNPTPAS